MDSLMSEGRLGLTDSRVVKGCPYLSRFSIGVEQPECQYLSITQAGEMSALAKMPPGSTF